MRKRSESVSVSEIRPPGFSEVKLKKSSNDGRRSVES
jgi:hypothetical protein